jgi:NADH-quinone oxidoreductase subunit M
VKVPMWPVHTWLPDVHLDGPTGAAVMLGMLKIGGYGLLRFALPITPQASHFFAPAMITLSLVAVIYSSLLALVQTDIRKLLAYSSIAHMGLVTLGLFIFNPLGQEGAIMQMISYGVVSGAMLLCTGMLYDRTQSGSIDAYGGVANTMPKFAVFVMLFSMANVGLPGTAGFVGEFMVLMGAIGFNFWIGAIAALTVILSAAYTLWMYKRVIFGAIASSFYSAQWQYWYSRSASIRSRSRMQSTRRRPACSRRPIVRHNRSSPLLSRTQSICKHALR